MKSPKEHNPWDNIPSIDVFLRRQTPTDNTGGVLPGNYGNSPEPPKNPRRKSPFIKGPLDLKWLLRVQDIPGKTAISVAMALYYQRGLKSSETVRLTTSLLEQFNLKPRSVYNALKSMEDAGLIRVTHKKGSCRLVEMLDQG